EAWLRAADLALDRSREAGRNTITCYQPAMLARAAADQELETELRAAVALNQLVLHYQPKVSMGDGRVAGFEALIRWQHPRRGLLSPGVFIPMAEELGLIGLLGEWVLHRACQEARSWPGDAVVAVNVATQQFSNARLVPTVAAALARSGLPPHRLEIEITETSLMRFGAGTLDQLNGLRALGVALALDDFGTGFSSLGYLRSFAFDRIKIDRSFIAEVPANEESASIARAILQLSRSLRMKTTAEGVETPDQLFWLSREGCAEAQGHLVGRPVGAGEVLRMLQASRHEGEEVLRCDVRE
ncbi:MAG TPA: EAL domain-containing protein, partial [Acetobacteraceae bacterium]|nr:EAL domain-containing protein [Acetobacteraceae bacterium]